MQLDTTSDLAHPGEMPGSKNVPWFEGIPENILEYLQPWPVLPWENPSFYQNMLFDVAGSLHPADYIEWLWVNDIVALAWTVRRARHAIVANVSMAQHGAIVGVLGTASVGLGRKWDQIEQRGHCVSACQVLSGNETGVGYLNVALKGLGMRPDAHRDMAYVAGLETTERLQSTINKAMAERDRIIGKLERRHDEASRRKLAAIKRFNDLADGPVQ